MFRNRTDSPAATNHSSLETTLLQQLDAVLSGTQPTLELPKGFETLENALNQVIGAKARFHGETLMSVNKLTQTIMRMDSVKDMVQDVERQLQMVDQIAASSEESAASIQEISSFVRDSANQALTVEHLSKSTLQDANTAVEQINQTFQEVVSAKEKILHISKMTQEIDTMVTIIKSVADQTNLLALNASIEAARAGEAGRGFAVVANEIKKLADSTKESVDIITQNVRGLRGGIADSVDAIEKASTTFESGQASIEKLASGMEKMGESVLAIHQNSERISSNVDEQSAATEEIASTLSSISENTHSLHEKCLDTGRCIHSLSLEVDVVRKNLLTSATDISDKDAVSLCIVDHLNWKWRVYNMILGFEKIDAGMVGTHTTCRLGRWIASRWSDRSELKGILDRIEDPHRRLHLAAGEAVKAYNSGNTSAAEAELKKIDAISVDVVKLLQEMQSGHF